MRYWLDTEFIENGSTIDLISIGIVKEDGGYFYAQNLECNFSRASDWVKENVFPGLTSFDMATLKPIINAEKEGGYGDWYSRASIAQKVGLSQMAGTSVIQMPDPEVEFWADYGAYDHVVLCQLFGTMMQLPDGWPMFTHDIQQLRRSLGSPELPKQSAGLHNALEDARWCKSAYEFLKAGVVHKVRADGEPLCPSFVLVRPRYSETADPAKITCPACLK